MRLKRQAKLIIIIAIATSVVYGQSNNTQPDRPQLISPLNDAVVVVRQQIFQVSAKDDDGDQLKFKIVIMESPEPPSQPGRGIRVWIFDQTQEPLGWDKESYRSGEVATLTVPESKIIPEGRYLWWALAYDGKEWSQISEQRRIKFVSNRPPSTPNLISPVGDETVHDLVFKLKADDPDGDLLKFKIIVAESVEPPLPPQGRIGVRVWVFDQTQDPSGWDKENYRSGEVATLIVPYTKLIPRGDYLWWALAYDGKEWSEISEKRKIKIANHIPSIPVLISPCNDAVSQPIFKVKAEDVDGDILMFKIVVAESGVYEPPLPVRGYGISGRIWVFDQTQDLLGWDKESYQSNEVATLIVPASKFIPKGNYLWWALAYDGRDWSRISEKRKVKIVNPPQTPTLLSPANGDITYLKPTFRLQTNDPDGDSVRFVIEVMKEGDLPRVFTTEFVDSGSVVNYTIPQPLSEGYWKWRAKALDADGIESEWSQSIDFIAAPQGIWISFVEPDEGLNYGIVEIKIHGAGFQQGLSVYMERQGQTIPGIDILVENETTIIAKFEITDKQEGLWDIVIKNQIGN